MGHEIESIGVNEVFEYDGDVHVQGGIGNNAKIKVIGNLTIDGSIGTGTDIDIQGKMHTATEEEKRQIALLFKQRNIILQIEKIQGVDVASTPKRALTIQGDVSDGVVISARNTDINVNGEVGNYCRFKTESGDIKLNDVGEGVSLETHSGNIHVKTLNASSSATSNSGNLFIDTMSEGTKVTANSGNVHVTKATKSAVITANSGNVYATKEAASAEMKASMGQVFVDGQVRVETKPAMTTIRVIYTGGKSNLTTFSDRSRLAERSPLITKQNQDDECCGCRIL